MGKNYRSCFVTDVSIESTYIKLVDSTKTPYYIDIQNKEVIDQFKQWFNAYFSKGVPQHLTVFEYSRHEKDGEVNFVIEKMFNQSSTSV